MLQVSIYPVLFVWMQDLDGCVRFVNSDNDTSRTLTENRTVIGAGFNNTLKNCFDACGYAGYFYAGMEGGKYCCTCRLFNGLSFPSSNQTSPLKGMTIKSIMAEHCLIKVLACCLARGITVRSVVDLTLLSFTNNLNARDLVASSVWAHASDGKVELEG